MVTTAPSRRARQRDATQRRLRAAAVDRFGRDGFTSTSVAAIAADAGVTERTFFRHFASKEAILFADFDERLAWFEPALAARPLDEPIVESVMAAIRTFPGDPEQLRQLGILRRQVLSAEAIETHIRLVQGAFSRVIEQALLLRMHHSRGLVRARDRELVAAVTANALGGALLAVLDLWTRHGGGDPDAMTPVVQRAFALLTELPLQRPGL